MPPLVTHKNYLTEVATQSLNVVRLDVCHTVFDERNNVPCSDYLWALMNFVWR